MSRFASLTDSPEVFRLPPIEGGAAICESILGWRSFPEPRDLDRYLKHVRDSHRKIPHEQLAQLAQLAGLPLAEVIASPFGLRMVALGVQCGARTLPVELGSAEGWPRRWMRERAYFEDSDHGTWQRGFLKLGKYQAFLAEAPHASFNPEYDSKWGPHELLHRAVGFFFREGASKFEIYLGARLNELLPVTTWYGLEQCFRLNEKRFERRVRSSPHVEDAIWRTNAVLDSEDARSNLLRFVSHLGAEWRAIATEISDSSFCPVSHEFVDTSSDARAYAVAHAARLADPTVARALTQHAELNVFRFNQIGSFRKRVEKVLRVLLCEGITLDVADVQKRQAERDGWHQSLLSCAAPKARTPKMSRALDQNAFVTQGIQSLAPTLMQHLPWAVPLVQAFVRAPQFVTRQPLYFRLVNFLGTNPSIVGVSKAEVLFAAQMLEVEGAARSVKEDERLYLADNRSLEQSCLEQSRLIRNRELMRVDVQSDILAALDALQTGLADWATLFQQHLPAPGAGYAVLVSKMRGEVYITPMKPKDADRLMKHPCLQPSRMTKPLTTLIPVLVDAHLVFCLARPHDSLM